MDWIHVLELVAPTALALTPAAPFIPAVLAGIKLAEAKGGTAAEKKALAVETAVAIGQGVEGIKAGTIDPETLGRVVDHGIETAVGVANLIHKGPAAVAVVSVDAAKDTGNQPPSTPPTRSSGPPAPAPTAPS